MLLQPVVSRSAAAALRMPTLLSRATFVTTARAAMAAGDVGAPPKTGGQGDAFQRRERASEDMAIRQREKEKLLELKKRIQEQRIHLDQLDQHIDDITRDSAEQKEQKDQQKDK